MNEFIAGMVEKAKVCPQRVCFPESWSPDIVKTAAEVVRTKIGTPVLIGNRAEVEKLAAENGVSTEGFEYFDSKDEAFVEAWTGRGDEKQDAQNFWRQLLQSVYGVEQP